MFEKNQVRFEEDSLKIIYTELLDWLDENGYTFAGDVHKTFNRKILTKDEVNELSKEYHLGKGYHRNHFYNINNKDKFILYNDISVGKILPNIIKMLKNFGIDEETIKTEGFSSKITKIKKFGEIDTDEEDFDLDEDDLTSVEEPVNKIKVYQQNPFRQSICVLGESGAGKSVTIETILENEGHNFEFIIPTAATTGLLAQFSPSKSGYVASRLGRMLIEASKNPDTLYTAVFDEMHKSNVIEMINDELLQSISTKRNRGRRFISLDDDTAEIYQGSELDTERGNLLIPDNFGFIFISSKPRVIANNADFFNRVDIVLLKSYQEEMVETTEQLLSNKLGDEEKMKLASTRND
jgi:hypothetical protein